MKNFILVAVLVVLVGLAIRYIYKAKKSGKGCIGCPYSGQCGGGSCGGCASNPEE